MGKFVIYFHDGLNVSEFTINDKLEAKHLKIVHEYIDKLIVKRKIKIIFEVIIAII
jgi:hypothetical protein